MKKNPQVEDRLERDRQQHLQDIAQIEQKLRNWKFGNDHPATSLQENIQAEQDIMGILSEPNSDIIYIEAEKLLAVMESKRTQAKKQLELIRNSVILADNEIQNKLIHRMDAEDIKYSVYKKLVALAKTDIYSETADAYQAIVDSLTDLKNLKGREGGRDGYVSVKKILHSTFYEAKVKAKLSYEACFSKLAALTRRMSSPDTLNPDIIQEFARQKILASRATQPLPSIQVR